MSIAVGDYMSIATRGVLSTEAGVVAVGDYMSIATWGVLTTEADVVGDWVALRASGTTQQNVATNRGLLRANDTTQVLAAESLHWPGAD